LVEKKLSTKVSVSELFFSQWLRKKSHAQKARAAIAATAIEAKAVMLVAASPSLPSIVVVLKRENSSTVGM